jgi:hypothetical protein
MVTVANVSCCVTELALKVSHPTCSRKIKLCGRHFLTSCLTDEAQLYKVCKSQHMCKLLKLISATTFRLSVL